MKRSRLDGQNVASSFCVDPATTEATVSLRRYDPGHPTFPIGGVDGITLNTDSPRLYYCPLTSRRLYSISTALLSDFGLSEDALAAAVVDEGEKGLADGLATVTHVYCTLGQWNRLPGFNEGKDLREPPYLIVRTPISPPPHFG